MELTAQEFPALIQTYGPLVYCSALRQTADVARAGEVTRAVFLTFANRARKLPKRTILAEWFFQTTALAIRKEKRKSLFRRFRFEWRRKWTLDSAILRLSKRQRRAVLLHAFLKRNEGFSQRALERGLRKLERRRVALEETSEFPAGLADEIVAAVPPNFARKPADPLTRRIVKTLRWRLRRRRFYIAVVTYHVALAIAIASFLAVDWKTGFSHSFSMFIVYEIRLFEWAAKDRPARAWSPAPPLSAAAVHSARDLYKMTNIWEARLGFTREQWKALQPRGIEPLPNPLLPNGLILLRNPKAPRSGFAGVLGYAYDWTRADFELGGLSFQDAGVRIKGNAGALAGEKHPFKVDLNRFAKDQNLAGLDELTFNNLLWDHSCLGDALAYEFFRDGGVPAPRTAFAWISASVEKKWENKPLGLYVMIEPVDAEFAKERFGSRRTPIFKPVTYELFKDLGPDWAAYAGIYDLKTKATDAQRQRIIDFSRLVTSANEVEFAAEVGNFLDLDEFARFLAGQVLISTYDGILSTGQNFYVYLDPGSNKLGFIPWDLDSAWGQFWIGKHSELERASLWHPWVGKNRFLERVVSLEEFRIIYRQRLEEMVSGLLVKERFQRRMDELAAVLRPAIAAESDFRLDKFEQFIGAKPVEEPKSKLWRVIGPVSPYLDFVKARAHSAREQLDGKTRGFIIKPPAEQ